MQLRELFDKPVPWKWIEQDPDRWEAQFNVNNIPYNVVMNQLTSRDEDEDEGYDYSPVWNVVFFDGENGVQFDITGKAGSQSIDVFSTVLHILVAFKKEHRTASLRFSAKEPSRQKLYHRIVTMIKKIGYHVEIDNWDGNQIYLVR